MLDTPILFIIFNRPETEKRVFEQIRKIKPKYLYVAADGPRKNRVDDVENCKLAREIVDNGVDWDCEVKKLYRNDNLGCKYAVSGAIDWFFKNVEEGIILEDDCLPDLSFFRFCEELLRKYRNNKSIMHISGDNFQCNEEANKYSYYYSRYPNIWGWATWRRSWNSFSVELTNWREKSSNKLFLNCDMLEKFFWISNFDKIAKNKIDTWDCQWLFNVFNNGGMAIIPNRNLVENIGFEHNATHFVGDTVLARKSYGIKFPLKHPNYFKTDWVKDNYSRLKVFRINILSVIYLNLDESLFYRWYIAIISFFKDHIISRWNFLLSILYQLSSGRVKIKSDPIVNIRVWGENLWMPFKHSLPIYVFKYKYYSTNLQRLSHFIFRASGKYSLLDVGANIGDSVCLVKKKTSQIQIYCFEGNDKYLKVLKTNTAKYNDVKVIPRYLGDIKKKIYGKVLSEGGSGMIISKKEFKSEIYIDTIDSVVGQYNIENIRLLKIDTDGYDGKILRGSEKVLNKYMPVIFFELDESFYAQNGDSAYETMNYLNNIEYKNVVMYDNYGAFLGSFVLPNKISKNYLSSIFDNYKSEYYDLAVFHKNNVNLFNQFTKEEEVYFRKDK